MTNPFHTAKGTFARKGSTPTFSFLVRLRRCRSSSRSGGRFGTPPSSAGGPARERVAACGDPRIPIIMRPFPSRGGVSRGREMPPNGGGEEAPGKAHSAGAGTAAV